MDTWWLDSKLSTARNHIPIPMYESLAFRKKNGLVMQNHKLQGIHSDKIWADSTTKNTLKCFKTYSTDLPKSANYLGYYRKKSSSQVHCPWAWVFNFAHETFFSALLDPEGLDFLAWVLEILCLAYKTQQ